MLLLKNPVHLRSDHALSFSEILEEAGACPTNFNPELDIENTYLSHYLYSIEATATLGGQRTMRYISAPATSVPSERLFSDTGEVYYDRRNRLVPERAEMLLFINLNNNFNMANAH